VKQGGYRLPILLSGAGFGFRWRLAASRLWFAEMLPRARRESAVNTAIDPSTVLRRLPCYVFRMISVSSLKNDQN